MTKFNDLKGKTLSSVEFNGVDSIKLTCVTGEVYVISYDQESYKPSEIEEKCSLIECFVGSKITLADMVVKERYLEEGEWIVPVSYILATEKEWMRWDIYWYYKKSIDFKLVE